MIQIGLLEAGLFTTAFYQGKLDAFYQKEFLTNANFPCELIPVNFDLINSFLPDGHEEIIKILQPVFKKADESGITHMLVPNITLHEVLDEMYGSFGFKWIHPVKIGMEYLKRAGSQSVSVLGTRHTMKRSYIRNYLDKAGMQVIDLSGQLIDTLDQLRLDVLAGNDRSKELEKILQDHSPAVDSLLLACTELSLAAENTNVFNVVDLAKGQMEKAIGIMM